MVQRYRTHKIKLRHHVLSQLMPLLERIASYDEVTAITPGVISPKRGPSVGLTLQYQTPSGLRLIGRTGGAAQEVYVVTQAPDLVASRMRTEGLIARPFPGTASIRHKHRPGPPGNRSHPETIGDSNSDVVGPSPDPRGRNGADRHEGVPTPLPPTKAGPKDGEEPVAREGPDAHTRIDAVATSSHPHHRVRQPGSPWQGHRRRARR